MYTTHEIGNGLKEMVGEQKFVDACHQFSID